MEWPVKMIGHFNTSLLLEQNQDDFLNPKYDLTLSCAKAIGNEEQGFEVYMCMRLSMH